ncbi:hypothetical protein EVAR_33685_1 [Eumeta japonica]|uniref:Uncharacterized protein n=1 Tax=Eumeta variegata TaxID=151549 RepID=A0A4C1VPL7_EUMVA|nr:hypothetical protein EVAR_33685_1 [Eumeta japonica]
MSRVADKGQQRQKSQIYPPRFLASTRVDGYLIRPLPGARPWVRSGDDTQGCDASGVHHGSNRVQVRAWGGVVLFHQRPPCERQTARPPAPTPTLAALHFRRVSKLIPLRNQNFRERGENAIFSPPKLPKGHLAINPNLVPAFNSGSGTVLDFDPFPVSDSALRPTFNSDTTHNFNSSEARCPVSVNPLELILNSLDKDSSGRTDSRKRGKWREAGRAGPQSGPTIATRLPPEDINRVRRLRAGLCAVNAPTRRYAADRRTAEFAIFMCCMDLDDLFF